MPRHYLVLIFLIPLMLLGIDSAINSHARIAFMGDSITDMGFWESGYCSLVLSGLRCNGIHARGIPAGICNETSGDMRIRFKRSVLDKEATVLLLSSGVNDVGQGVPLKTFEDNITAMVEAAQRKGLAVYLLTASMLQEDPHNRKNRTLEAYNEFLRNLSRQKHCTLVDINRDMQRLLVTLQRRYPQGSDKLITSDGLHMNIRGNIMMATCVLRAFGLSQEQIQKATENWLQRRDTISFRITLDEYRHLDRKARMQGLTVQEYVFQQTMKTIRQERTK